jgi:hypothetical protein
MYNISSIKRDPMISTITYMLDSTQSQTTFQQGVNIFLETFER